MSGPILPSAGDPLPDAGDWDGVKGKLEDLER